MLNLKRVTQVYGMRAFTEEGVYFGDIEEAILQNNKVYGWRIKSTRNSFLAQAIGNAKGVIVPHQFVRAIGDIVLVSKTVIPSFSGKKDAEEVEIKEVE